MSITHLSAARDGTTAPRVLFVAHNHPALHPGGTEVFSHGLFRELKRRRGVEGAYLACVDRTHRGALPGTLLQVLDGAADELLLWTGHFDRFHLSQTDLHGVVPEFERLLRAVRPDVVHFHHMLMIGVEAFQVVRRTLPDAAIVLTLHDYYPICANDGQMATAQERKLCRRAAADACVRCFPDLPRDAFVMRELFVKQAMSFVDRFLSPSEFLKRRYVEWGLPEDRIEVMRNGQPDEASAPPRSLPLGSPRNRFAFFGNLNPYKGALVALEAARLLAGSNVRSFSLVLHGAARFQTDAFKAEIEAAAKAAAPHVRLAGPYEREDLPVLVADADWVVVPSVWWENAPLVIEEAFLHGRPVICSGIGGMAEAVRDGIDGLWVRPGDPEHLAERMYEAMDPEVWDLLVRNIRRPRRLSEAADEHLALYEQVIAARQWTRAAAGTLMAG